MELKKRTLHRAATPEEYHISLTNTVTADRQVTEQPKKKNRVWLVVAAAAAAAVIGLVAGLNVKEKPVIPTQTAETQGQSERNDYDAEVSEAPAAAGTESGGTETREVTAVREENPEETAAAADETDSAAEDGISVDWQQLYYDFLQKYSAEDMAPTFALLYIDEDDIPELVMNYNGTGRFEQVDLYTIYQNEVCSLGKVGNFSTLNYMEKENLIDNPSFGAMGYRKDLVQEIRDGRLNTIAVFEWDDMEETYRWGTSEDTMKETDPEEQDAVFQTCFPENEVKSTPYVMDDEGYRCTTEELNRILTDPASVTI